jgi:hypothetical protein
MLRLRAVDLPKETHYSSRKLPSRASASASVKVRTRLIMLLTWLGLVGMNDRFSTRPTSGRKSIAVELIFKLFLTLWFL